MARQTRDTAMPIRVMTVRRSSWTLPSPCTDTDRVCYGLTLNCCAFYNISVYGCVQIRRKELHDIPVAEEWLQMLPYNLIYY